MGYSLPGGCQVKGWHSQKGRTHPCIERPLTSEGWSGKGNTQTHLPFASYTLLPGVISPLDTSKRSLTCTDNMPLAQQGPVSFCWLWCSSHFHPFLCLVFAVFHSLHVGLEFPKESGSNLSFNQTLQSFLRLWFLILILYLKIKHSQIRSWLSVLLQGVILVT